MTFPVKWYDSAMQGSTLLTTSVGSLIAMLKTVLVTGFGSMPVSTLVYDSSASTITVTVETGHKYLVGQIVAVAGANEAGFNGEFRVVSVTSTTVVVGLDNGTPAASSATGTLSMNIPSLGWVVEFEDATNYKIIFKRIDTAATPIRLLVDNSAWSNWNQNYGEFAKVSMVEDVVDINTYTTVQTYTWPSSHAYATAEWQVVGDSLMLYFIPTFGGANLRSVYAFGDINSIRPGDQYHCLLTGNGQWTDINGWWTQTTFNIGSNFALFANGNEKSLARNYHQLPGVSSCHWRGLYGAFGEGMSFPNPADNGFYVSTEPVPVHDASGYRGSLPGVVVPYATATGYNKANLNNLPGLPGRLIRLLVIQKQFTSENNPRLIGFDIKGPWR